MYRHTGISSIQASVANSRDPTACSNPIWCNVWTSVVLKASAQLGSVLTPSYRRSVTYQPPGRRGVEELQWLDSLSKPKQVTAKSESAKRGAPSTQQSGQQSPSAGKLHQPPTEPFQQQRQQAASQVQHCQYLGSHRKGLPPEAAAAVEKSTTSAQQAAAEAAISAACLTERQLVSYPQVFSWGGRVKGKHSSLCRMQAGAQAIGAGVTSQAARTTDAATTLSNSSSSSSSTKPSHGSSSTGNGQRLQQHAVEPPVVPGAAQNATSKPDLCPVSGNGTAAQQAGLGMLMETMRVADADVSAAAAQLGANADILMHLLESRKQKQQQKGAPRPKQQYSKTARATPSRRVDDFVGGVEDEPIGGGLDYLRL